jgi:hypothetical protein
MAFVHGRLTYISLDGDDLSAFTNASELNRTADSHEVTCYGASSKAYVGGLLDGTSSISGVYDNSATGPRAIIEPLIGTVVELVRRPDGTGSGKAQDTVDVLVTGYTESSPVGDMVTWSADLQCTGDIVSAAQGA